MTLTEFVAPERDRWTRGAIESTSVGSNVVSLHVIHRGRNVRGMGLDAESHLLTRLAAGVGVTTGGLRMTGSATFESFYPVSALATASIAVAGLAVADWRDALGLPRGTVEVNRALADDWFGLVVRPVGWELPSPWDPIAGDYRTRGAGWIRLHTNAPHHREAALRVVGVAEDRDANRDDVAGAVARWDATELEAAIVGSGGCAAELRTPAEWAQHSQGVAVSVEPLVHTERTDSRRQGADAATRLDLRSSPSVAAPLAGVRVLDLTRVLAGPAATRFLAGLGAEVLRVDPPGWDEPALVPEMTLGKRAARLDAGGPEGLARLRELLAHADVLVSGYRRDALERLGLGDEVRRSIRPGLVDVALNAYGWTGPWSARRGFDSLVQMSTGIAGAGMSAGVSDTTTPLPFQALDQATGYLAAAAVLAGLTIRAREGVGVRSRLSLARTAVELESARKLGREPRVDTARDGTTRADADVPIETPWGPATLRTPPLTIDAHALAWNLPPRALGTDDAVWSRPRH